MNFATRFIPYVFALLPGTMLAKAQPSFLNDGTTDTYSTADTVPKRTAIKSELDDLPYSPPLTPQHSAVAATPAQPISAPVDTVVLPSENSILGNYQFLRALSGLYEKEYGGHPNYAAGTLIIPKTGSPFSGISMNPEINFDSGRKILRSPFDKTPEEEAASARLFGYDPDQEYWSFLLSGRPTQNGPVGKGIPPLLKAWNSATPKSPIDTIDWQDDYQRLSGQYKCENTFQGECSEGHFSPSLSDVTVAMLRAAQSDERRLAEALTEALTKAKNSKESNRIFHELEQAKNNKAEAMLALIKLFMPRFDDNDDIYLDLNLKEEERIQNKYEWLSLSELEKVLLHLRTTKVIDFSDNVLGYPLLELYKELLYGKIDGNEAFSIGNELNPNQVITCTDLNSSLAVKLMRTFYEKNNVTVMPFAQTP